MTLKNGEPDSPVLHRDPGSQSSRTLLQRSGSKVSEHSGISWESIQRSLLSSSWRGKKSSHYSKQSLHLHATKEAATLRAELELRQDQAATAESRMSFKCRSCFRGLGTTFEPKDLDLTALAQKKFGEDAHWGNLAVSDQVEIIQDALSCRHYTMNPNSDYMLVWDLIVAACLVFTATVTPVEIAFLKPGYNFLYFVNRFVDIVFVKDMALQFLLQVRTVTKQGVVWLKSKRDIANAYFRSWFILDLLAVLPYDDVSTLLTSKGGSSGLEKLKTVRLLRVLRLFKLLRILKTARVLKRWETRIGLRYVVKYLAYFTILIVVACHWMACIWGFFGVLDGTALECRETLEPGDPRLEEFPDRAYFVGDEDADPFDPQQWQGHSWIVRLAASRVAQSTMNPCSTTALYFASVYWATMTMTSVGYGDIVPLTISEYLVGTLCMMGSSILWAYIISAACGIMMNMDKERQEFESRMDAFNDMAQDRDLPSHIRHTGRDYIRQQRYHERFLRNAKAMESIGHSMNSSVAKLTTMNYISGIWFFKPGSLQFKTDIGRKMEPHFFERRSLVKQPGNLCVIEHGSVGRGGRVLVPWNYWGDDILLGNPSLCIEKLCYTLTYTELVILTRERLSAVLEEYPDELAFLRRCAVCIATVRSAYIFQKQSQGLFKTPDLEWVRVIYSHARAVGQRDLSKRKKSRHASLEAELPPFKHLGEEGRSLNKRLELMHDQLYRLERLVFKLIPPNQGLAPTFPMSL